MKSACGLLDKFILLLQSKINLLLIFCYYKEAQEEIVLLFLFEVVFTSDIWKSGSYLEVMRGIAMLKMAG